MEPPLSKGQSKTLQYKCRANLSFLLKPIRQNCVSTMHHVIGIFIPTITIILTHPLSGSSHGRLLEPPGRSSLWRFPQFENYKPPKNYDDNQLFCGGFERQFKKNGGRCGPCGDPFDEPIPRENENGGMYGRGIMVRDYRVGQVMDIGIELTRSHKGYFQFRLCPLNDPAKRSSPETQPCFNQFLLPLADGSGTKYRILQENNKSDFHNLAVVLPPGLQCQQCVLQWHYRTGNSWGNCTDGKQGLGCGNQEVFRGCADISIN